MMPGVVTLAAYSLMDSMNMASISLSCSAIFGMNQNLSRTQKVLQLFLGMTGKPPLVELRLN